MSGITALFSRGRGSVTRDDSEAMLDSIDHRGPDGRGAWVDDDVALGHQQLQSTPQGAFDDQPARDGALVVTADARLDNREALLDECSISRDPERVPDSQLLLAAYRRWGRQCPDRLDGSFAFVVWDGERERLFCARDHFGVKPFYYHPGDDTFAVASEKKALLELPSVPGEVDETKIGDFLVAMYEDRERTYFESVRRLPPAHAMTVGREETNTWQYWDLDPTRTVTLASDAAYERQFRDLFEQAVESRLRTDGKVGCALSGGMDSSSITVVARDLLPAEQPLYTFSNVYDDAPSSDEREFIEAVVDRDGIESEYVFPEDVGTLGDEEWLRTYFDQPPHNTMHFAVCSRTKRASETGVGVVLGGAMGDSAIGYGLGLLPELFWTGRWRHLYGELKAMGEVTDAPVRHLFGRHVLSEVLPGQVVRWMPRLSVDGSPSVADENPMLDGSFVERIGLESRYETMSPSATPFTPRARRLQRRSVLTGRNTTNFEALDLVHAALGVEPRYPFTDTRLVEFSLAMPPTQQFKNGWTRSIARRALGDLLPEKVQWRPWKTPTNEAFWNALSRDEGRLEGLAESPGPLAEYVTADGLAASRDRFDEERNSRDGRALWRALSLSVWLDDYGF